MNYVVNNLSINVLEEGSGSVALVFLHYFGGSALEWQSVISQLSSQYRCLAIDLRGHGDSEAPKTGYSVDDMADDVSALIQLLAVQNFVLIGHSMSGKVALALAARQPDGLRMLITVSTSPPTPEPIPDEERQRLLESYGQRKMAEQTQKNITEAPISTAIQKQIVEDNLRTSKLAWDAWLLAGSKEDISNRMALITVPVHGIVGLQDRALSPDVQFSQVMPYLKFVTLKTIDNAGHLLPYEVPKELVAFILACMY